MIDFLKRLVDWLFGFDRREVALSKAEVIEVDLGDVSVLLDLESGDRFEIIQKEQER